MEEKDLDQFMNKIGSRYRAVIVAAKRARQLQRGLRPLFEGKSSKVTTMALEELINGSVEYVEMEPKSEKDDAEKAVVSEKNGAATSPTVSDTLSIEDVFPEMPSGSSGTDHSEEPRPETKQDDDTETPEQST